MLLGTPGGKEVVEIIMTSNPLVKKTNRVTKSSLVTTKAYRIRKFPVKKYCIKLGEGYIQLHKF